MTDERGSSGYERDRPSSLEIRGGGDNALEWRLSQLEFRFEFDEEKRQAISRCLETGDLRMVLQNAQIDVLSQSLRGGDGYLWD